MEKLFIILALFILGCGTTTTERRNLPPLQTVDKVDLERYAGKWFEIASYPQSFQEGCTGTTATYTKRPDGEFDVRNQCYLETLDGELDEAHGRARIVEEKTNAKLEVSFFRPFWGDYWVIELDPDYAYAVVGHPSRDYLWILSREPTLPAETYAQILERLTSVGYETDRLVRTIQK